FGARLPFLMKVLAVERPLSLQVHPDQYTARAGYDAASDGAYKDPYHKPELLYAIGHFRALCGLRTLDELLPVLGTLASSERHTATFAQITCLLEDSGSTPHRRVAAYIAGLSDSAAAGAITDLLCVRDRRGTWRRVARRRAPPDRPY